MFMFGNKSNGRLDSVHSSLHAVADLALNLSPYDFTIVHGHRGEVEQNLLFMHGLSQLEYPNGKHNKRPSEALDFAPWVNNFIPWNDTHIFCVIAGCFFAAAKDLNISIRWGGDWDSDGSTKDQQLMDYGHIELMTGGIAV